MLRTTTLVLVVITCKCLGAAPQTPTASRPTPSPSPPPQVMGCYFQTKSFHAIEGPCIPYLTGFRVLFDSAAAAIDAGYKPCDFCGAEFRPAYNRKVAAIQQRWRTYVKSVEGAGEAATERDASASYADSVGSGYAAAAAFDRKEARTDYGAAGLALLSGYTSAARRLARRAAAREQMAEAEEGVAEAWFGVMARQASLANYNRQYALEATSKYLTAVSSDALWEMEAERKALQRSVALLGERKLVFEAAMTAGLAWMVATASGHDDHIRAAAATMERAISAYKEQTEPEDPKWVNNTLSAAWDLGTHGYPAFGIMASYLIASRYPANTRASQVYGEVWQACVGN